MSDQSRERRLCSVPLGRSHLLSSAILALEVSERMLRDAEATAPNAPGVTLPASLLEGALAATPPQMSQGGAKSAPPYRLPRRANGIVRRRSLGLDQAKVGWTPSTSLRLRSHRRAAGQAVSQVLEVRISVSLLADRQLASNLSRVGKDTLIP